MTKKISRNEADVLERALSYESDKLGVNIYRMNGFLTRELKFGINWSAQGTKSPNETKKYAESMIKAANICEWVNAQDCELDYELNKDEAMTREEYIKKTLKYVDFFEDIILGGE